MDYVNTSNPILGQVLNKTQNVTTHVKNFGTLMWIYNRVENTRGQALVLKPKLSVKTRWNSEYDEIKQFSVTMADMVESLSRV